MWGTIAGAAMGMLQNYTNAKAAIRANRQRVDAAISGIKASEALYEAQSDITTITRDFNREEASNAIVEHLRAGAEDVREFDVQAKQALSKISAASEGITAGVSKARMLSSAYVDISKKRGQLQEGSRASIINIADKLQEVDNSLVAQDSANYNNLLYSLATGAAKAMPTSMPSATLGINTMMKGIEMGSNFNNLLSSNKPSTPNVRVADRLKGL